VNNCNCELCYFGLYLTFDITSRGEPSLPEASGEGYHALPVAFLVSLPSSLPQLTFSAEMELREGKTVKKKTKTPKTLRFSIKEPPEGSRRSCHLAGIISQFWTQSSSAIGGCVEADLSLPLPPSLPVDQTEEASALTKTSVG
jgi:hypothetical protein